ncbi:hydroxymethylbilane synthase [Verrucomicrobiaceae bacterium N1E253]|uniref:Hydroxymethylbilane synthase n=1 Tax=Oceaniferula marina TaxID=2748318 RepID=A0A851GNE4_9BACT|nr:hydroxymethylbilane synthase [Oceaniferula marina]NWK57361.1 hydroxymethylbilane synthase [Oceaniferula marina]
MMKPLVIGTRGSALALVQAEMTEAVLAQVFPDREVIRKVIQTTGDRRTDVPLSEVAKVEGVLDKGVFTKELEVALEAGEIDLAVHSMKDVPTVLADCFEIAGVLERAPVRDVLISCHDGGLQGLPEGATVATSSVRRQRQLLFLRPDLKLVDIRGNVPTRLRKLAEQDELDAIMLAEAGLIRLNYDLSQPLDGGLWATPLDAGQCLPAASQGIVGFEIRKSDVEVREVVESITHASSMVQCRAEREFLRLLDAGCHTPVGVRSWIVDGTLHMDGRVFYEEEKADLPPREAQAQGDAGAPEQVASQLYASLT